MPLVEQLTELAEELEGPGFAEATVVAKYIRDELIPLAVDEDAELDAEGVVESLQEINEWTNLVIGRVEKFAAEHAGKCHACNGSGRNPMSDNTNWLTCQQCGGSGKGKAAKSA